MADQMDILVWTTCLNQPIMQRGSMRKLFFALMLAGALCACENSFVEEENFNTDNQPSTEIPEDYVRLDLLTEEDPAAPSENSRTAHSGNGKLVWCTGDKVSVNGTVCEVVADGNAAYVYAPSATSYKVFYPADIYSAANAMMLQPSQGYAEGSFGNNANPMYGTSNSANGVVLRSVCGVAKLRLTGSATISSIAITDKSGSPLSGKFDFEDGEASPVSGSVAHPSVVLNCENVGGVKLTASGKDFYIVMPARNYPSGWKVSITDTDNRAVVIDSSTPRTIKVNDIVTLPTIAYAPDKDLLYAEYFDKNIWGAERYGGSIGFSNTKGASATGYELSKTIVRATASNPYGSPAISTTWDTMQVNDMSESYLKSRGLDTWQLLFQSREVYGALAVGHPTSHRGIVAFPKLSNLAQGEVCMAQVTFKVAFLNGATSDPLLVNAYSKCGPGCVLAYYLDGKKINIPKDGAYWTNTQNTQPIPVLPVGSFDEKLVINNPANNEIKDAEWHTVRVDFGAVTRDTSIGLQSYSAHSAVSEYLIDDIEIRKVAYPYQDDAEHYVISKGTVSNAKKLMLPISATIGMTSTWMNNIHQLKSLGVEYVDLSIGYDFFYNPTGNNGDTAKWDSALQTAKAKLDAAGLKVWHIHLPGIGTKWTKNSDGTYSSSNNSDLVDFAHKTESIRAAAVAQMTTIIQHVAKGLSPKYVLIHPSGYRDGGVNGAYLYTGTNSTARKASLVKSLKELVAVCKSAGTELVMENLGNTGSPINSLTIQPEYINYFMSNAPGAKFCFDFSHGTINLYNTGASFIKGLNKGILTALHVHGGGNDKDVHLFPGYSGMYSYKDKLEWGETYEALINYGYRGPFTYEPGSYAVDCNASWSTLIHNYYNYVYPAYRKKMGN